MSYDKEMYVVYLINKSIILPVLAQMLQVHGQLYWPKCYRSMVSCIGPNVTGPWSAVLAQMLQVHGRLYWPKLQVHGKLDWP